jgi:hypothetical protein
MKVIIFVGVILIAVGAFIFQSDMKVKINRQIANAEDSQTAKTYIGGGIIGLGSLFVLGGLLGLVLGNKQQKRNQHILQNGIAVVGTVTFVDRNWAVLVNKNPIYSIVEYTYKDKSGNSHTRKISNISSEIVIRKQIQVGSKISIKYASENPVESVMVI